nr:thioredoxin domain-containing protein [Auraticoccus cholistanensis]
MLGGGDGARTLTVWADFSCPHCADFATGYRDVLHEAVAAGHVRLELAPLTFVQPPASVRAGNAFACATEAGFGPAYHDALFASWRADWDDEVLLALAEQVSPGLPESFTRCVRDTGAQSYLDSVDAASRTAGVEATPTVLLDGAPLDLATTTPASLAAQLQETP